MCYVCVVLYCVVYYVDWQCIFMCNISVSVVRNVNVLYVGMYNVSVVAYLSVLLRVTYV